MNEMRTAIIILVAELVLCIVAVPAVATDGINIIEEWNTTFGGMGDDYAYSVQQTTDGGYIIAGYTHSYGAGDADIGLTKTDSKGTEEWNRTFGGAEADLLDRGSVRQTSDGGYIITGYTYSYGAGAGDADAWLIKTNPDGTEQWNRTFGGECFDWGHSVRQTADGGYIIAGRTEPYAGARADAWLIKTDSNGVEEWNRTFGADGCEYATSVQQTSDGGYIITGRTTSFGAGEADAWLIRTDSNGIEEWNRTFGGANYDYGYSVQQTTDGGYVIAGSTNGRQDIWLIKTDTDGIEEWSSIFGGPAKDEGYSVQQTIDGGYIVAGYTESYGAGSADVWLIKTDSDGIEQWNRTSGGTGLEKGYSVLQTSARGYIVTGYTNSFSTGGYDVWVIKLSPSLSPAGPDLTVSMIDAYHYNTGESPWLNLSNEVEVKVENIGTATAEAFNVSLYADDEIIGKQEVSSGLEPGLSRTVQFKWIPIGEDCLKNCTFAYSHKDYNLTGIADCDNEVNEGDEVNNNLTKVETVCYNGYMADEPLENIAHGTLHGGLLFTTGDGIYGGLYSVGSYRNTTYEITLPASASVVLARLNVYYTWHYEKTSCPAMEVSITNATGTYIVPLERDYNDIKCQCPGAPWVFPWGNYVYDITDYIHGSGTYMVTVKRTGDPSFCIAAPGIEVVYEDENKPLIEYWIAEGADILIGGRREDGGYLSLEECINNATFEVERGIELELNKVKNATLGVVSSWAGSAWMPGMSNYLYFNDIVLGQGVYHGYSSPYNKTVGSITMHIGSTNAQVGVNVSDVTSYLNASNNRVGQGDNGDNLMPSNAFLVVEYEDTTPPQGNPGAGCHLETKYYGTINGGIYFEQQGWMQFGPMTKTFNDVPDGIRFARVYTGVWGGSPGKGGDFNITVNGHTSPTYHACDPCPQYNNCEPWQPERCDTVNTSECHDYVTGCNVHFISYNATPYIVPGSNTVTVKAVGNQSCPRGKWDGRIYLIALLVVYEDASMPEMTYGINEGAPFMEDNSYCDGPDDHYEISFYFSGAYVSNPYKVKYWTLGFPHVANATTEPAYMKLNGNNIGKYDYKEKQGGYEVFYRWDNIPASYLNPSSNLFCYYEPYALYGGYGMYERVNVAVLICEAPAPSSKVLINEFVAKPSSPNPEWIELYNPTGSDVSLDGWTIGDGSGATSSLNGKIVSANGYLVLNSSAGDFGFTLNDSGDIIYLNKSTTTVDKVAYGDWDDGNMDDNAPKPNIDNSTGRYPNGKDTDVDAEDFIEFGMPTPGAQNIKPGSIVGRITYACNGTGIADVNVNVNLTKGSTVNTTVTNETGYYNFTNVVHGSYLVNASKLRFYDNSTEITVIAGETATADMMLWLKGDLNNKGGIIPDAGDVVLMLRASVGDISGDMRYDLNGNGEIADVGDVVLMLRASASVEDIELL